MKFGDRVRVISGFYKGLEGIVTDYRIDNFGNIDYYFEGSKIINELCLKEIGTWINPNELEKI